MLFIHPMWDSECERVGKQRCTPIGHALHVIADLLGISGLVMLFVAVNYLAYHGIAGTFHLVLCWLLALPFAAAVMSEVLYHLSWWLALWRGFRYDSQRMEASWLEDGQHVAYRGKV